MNARGLLEELRQRDVRLKADGLLLQVDAPADLLSEELRADIRANKRMLIRLLERERRKLENADRRGLVIRFAREPGYLSVHDPTTGDWHELQTSSCLPWMLEDAKAYRRRRGRNGR